MKRMSFVTPLAAVVLMFSAVSLLLFVFRISGHIGSNGHIVVSNKDFFAIEFAAAVISFSGYLLFKSRAIYLIVFCLGLSFIILNPYFDVIDEQAHFSVIYFLAHHLTYPSIYEYVDNQILSLAQHTLPFRSPTDPRSIGMFGRVYEAFQPPLYYFLGALWYVIIPGGLVAKVYGLRSLGLLLLMVSVFIFRKTYFLLVNHGLIEHRDLFLFSVSCLFFVNPGVMLRMTTISNLHLLLPLIGALLYTLIRYMFTEHTGIQEMFVLTVLSACVVLTQFTAIFVLPIVFLVLYFKKGIKFVGYSAVTFAIALLPWIIYNLATYGHLTANGLAELQQKDVVNPGNVNYGVGYIVKNLSYFIYTYWNPQQATPNDAFSLPISYALTVLILFIVTYSLVSLRDSFFKERNKFHIAWISALFVCMNVGLMLLITVSQNWPVMIGRYVYPSLTPLAVLIFMHFNSDDIKKVRTISVFFVIFSTLLWTNSLSTLLRMETVTLPKPPKVVSLGLQFNNNDHVDGGIVRKGEIFQTFRSPYANLEGVSILTATYGMTIKDLYWFELVDAKSMKVIRIAQLDPSRIKNGEFYDVSFPAIQDSGSKNYIFTIFPTGNVKTPMTLEFGKPGEYKEGHAILKGKIVNKSIIFQLIYG